MRRPNIWTLFVALSMLAGCGPAEPPAPPETPAAVPETPESPAAAAADERPNILFIMADDLGYTDVGFFGGEIPTPNLDALAFDGVRLTNFHAAPYCAATRASLFSGTTAMEAGLARHNDPLRPDVATLPDRLAAAGYHTYMAGKWNLGITAAESAQARGFESSYALGPPADNHLGHSNYPPVSEFAPDGAYLENGQAVTLPEDWFSSDLFTDKLIEYIGANVEDGVPWFGYLALTAPHWPLQAPDDWIDRYVDQYDGGYDALREARVASATELGVLPEGLTLDGYLGRAPAWDDLNEAEKDNLARAMEIYAAMVENIDWNFGRLVEFLEASGELEDTVIVFTSDNGPSGGDDTFYPSEMPRTDNDNSLANMGREWSFVAYGRGWGEAASAPFRDVKSSMYAGGTLVPTFVHHGTVANKGGFERAHLTIMDLLPTFVDIAGEPAPTEEFQGRAVVPVRGRSFWDLIQGGAAPEPVVTPWMTTRRGLVNWPWKIVAQGTPQEQRDQLQWGLYNLEADPGERQDLSDRHPDVKSEMEAHWAEYASRIGIEH